MPIHLQRESYKNKNLLIFYSVLLLLLILCSMSLFASNSEIKQIQDAIQANDAKWIAGENWVTRLPIEKQKRLLGQTLEPPVDADLKYIKLTPQDTIPTDLDWRDNDGSWVTQVRNQGDCGSCWLFSAVAQVETWWNIINEQPDTSLDLSEQFIISCAYIGGCGGGDAYDALEWIAHNGVPSESCLPYEASNGVPCENSCSNWQDEAITIPGWGFITLDEPIIDNIKTALMRHPISANFTVYEDFLAYESGVYEHVYGSDLGGHAILIVGWDDSLECWICKNSWDSDWGEDGYFRIKWGNSGIGKFLPFIYDKLISGPSLTVPSETLNFSLTAGDVAFDTITIKNISSDFLEFSTIGCQVPFAWHPDTFQAYDGLSWWCGDPLIGGYKNKWLQYLETYMLDLTCTVNPVLTFMANWSIESPIGTIYPWDGWDGCNVWISTNGGRTYEVLQPVTPDYYCQHLWSFGHPEMGWGMGTNIPGWAGSSDGWIPVEFDLTPYDEDSVKIRWALASDQGFCTIDDHSIYGIIIDNINICDASQTVFEDFGDSTSKMNRFGLGNNPATWINFYNSGGILLPGDSTEIIVVIEAFDMEPGEYHGIIKFNTNDTTETSPVIPCNLELVAPDHDISLVDIWFPGDNPFILSDICFGVEVRNCGKNDEVNIKVLAVIYEDGTEIYRDSNTVSYIHAGEMEVLYFNPILFSETKELNIYMSIIDFPNDYNDRNNSFSQTVTVSYLVDGFNSKNALWEMDGGWDIGFHNGISCVYISGDSIPYPDNIDAKLTFKPGFVLSNVDAATVRYNALFQIEEGKGICYIEASEDSINWIKLDSLTSRAGWKDYEINLTDLITQGCEKIWIRFHFLSGAQNDDYLIAIRFIEIFPELPSLAIVDKKDRDVIPAKFQLSQNYPNPFNSQTKIDYQIAFTGYTTLSIFNCWGQLVEVLVNQQQKAGYYSVIWDAGDLPSGIYFYQINAGNFSKTMKMVLLK